MSLLNLHIDTNFSNSPLKNFSVTVFDGSDGEKPIGDWTFGAMSTQPLQRITARAKSIFIHTSVDPVCYPDDAICPFLRLWISAWPGN